jgi:acyl-CoA thioester hydrolase
VRRSTLRHRVAFFETDAMAVVHHANYVRYLELARIAWMDEYDRPYREYVAEGLHFSTTRVEIEYLRPALFDDVIEITTWLDWIGGASLAMAYEVTRNGDALATAATEHAMVDGQGRPCRIPAERRLGLKNLAVRPFPGAARRARGGADASR